MLKTREDVLCDFIHGNADGWIDRFLGLNR